MKSKSVGSKSKQPDKKVQKIIVEKRKCVCFLSQWSKLWRTHPSDFLWLMTLKACEGGGTIWSSISDLIPSSNSCHFRFLIWSTPKNPFNRKKIESWIGPLVVFGRKIWWGGGAIQSWIIGCVGCWIWLFGVISTGHATVVLCDLPLKRGPQESSSSLWYLCSCFL